MFSCTHTAKPARKPAVVTQSFVQNMFRGMVEPAQAFPYPNVLNMEQRETLEMLVPPTEKFMTEVNDPLLNDAQEAVPESTVQVPIHTTIKYCTSLHDT